MCQGLPCVGSKVKLKESRIVEGFNFGRGREGIIREEDVEQRRVRVHFPDYNRTIWLPESAVEEVLD